MDWVFVRIVKNTLDFEAFKITIEDLKMSILKYISCRSCNGTGVVSFNGSDDCRVCGGDGVERIRMGLIEDMADEHEDQLKESYDRQIDANHRM